MAEVYEEHLLSRMNAEVTLSEEDPLPALTGYCFTRRVCAAPIRNERNFTVAVSGAEQCWE